MAPFVRILLRYLTLPLVLLGWVLPEEQAEIIGDPEVVFWTSQGLGFLAGLAAEGWYWLARRFKWDR